MSLASIIKLFAARDRSKYIKIYGLPRSGTNYIAKLLEVNFRARVLLHVGHGKHNDPKFITEEDIRNVRNFDREGLKGPEEIYAILKYMEKNNIYYVMIVKHPIQWIKSYRNYIRKYPNPNLPHVFRIDESPDDLKAAINWWNETTKEYIRMRQSNPEIVHIIQYESLVSDFADVLSALKHHFNLQLLHNELTNYHNIMLPGFHASSQAFNPNSLALDSDSDSDKLTDQQLAIIYQEMDPEIIRVLNLQINFHG